MSDKQDRINELEKELRDERLDNSQIIKNYSDMRKNTFDVDMEPFNTAKLQSETRLNNTRDKYYPIIAIVLPLTVSLIGVVIALIKT